MNPALQRALLLYQQSRFDLAENELRRALADDPDEGYAHALLALCLAEREQFPEASEEAQRAVHLGPDDPFAHYATAKVWYDRNHLDAAADAIAESIRLDPADADHHSLLAAVRFDQKRWQDALDSAEQGLQTDPEHVGCTNLRAMALVKLGRKAEAGATIETALARNPENSVTHANQGWTLIERGDYGKALEHFRESLRLDPANEWARQGIIEALKAKNVVYALVLRYFLWMSRLSSGVQWGIILAGYFGNRILGSIAEKSPELAPWIWPVRIVYLAFVFLTWCADPLFNLLLRLNRFGRLVLSPEQILASNLVGACVLASALSLAGCLMTSFEGPLVLGMLLAFLVIPVSSTFKAQKGWPRTTLAVFSVVLAAAGLGMLIFGALSEVDANLRRLWRAAGAVCLSLYLLGIIGAPWIANFLLMQRPRR
jgi:tetratricopeptide (TPR) repeat protein